MTSRVARSTPFRRSVMDPACNQSMNPNIARSVSLTPLRGPPRPSFFLCVKNPRPRIKRWSIHRPQVKAPRTSQTGPASTQCQGATVPLRGRTRNFSTRGKIEGHGGPRRLDALSRADFDILREREIDLIPIRRDLASPANAL
jgi:hypothetical protein